MIWRENGRCFRTNKMKVTDKNNKQVWLTFCLKEQMLPQAHKHVKNKKLLFPNLLQKNGTNIHPVAPLSSTCPKPWELSSVSSTPYMCLKPHSSRVEGMCLHHHTQPPALPSPRNMRLGGCAPQVLPFCAPPPPPPSKHISSCPSIFWKPFRDFPLPQGQVFFKS